MVSKLKILGVRKWRNQWAEGSKWEMRKPLWVTRSKPPWETDRLWSLKHPVQSPWLDPSPIPGADITQKEFRPHSENIASELLEERHMGSRFLHPRCISHSQSHLASVPPTTKLPASSSSLSCLFLGSMLSFFLGYNLSTALPLTLCHSYLGVFLTFLG